MDTDRSSETEAMRLQWLMTHMVTLCTTGLVIFLWFELGPDNLFYALLVASWTANLGRG